MTIDETIAKITEALQDRNLVVVAAKTSVSFNTIHAFKTGKIRKPHATTVRVLAHYLGVGDA